MTECGSEIPGEAAAICNAQLPRLYTGCTKDDRSTEDHAVLQMQEGCMYFAAAFAVYGNFETGGKQTVGDFLEMKGSDMVIIVPAELDHHRAEQIRREADRIMTGRQVQRIIFDFQNTVFMDSAGIGMIMGRYKLVQSQGGTVIAIHVNDRVRRILTLSGIHKIVAMYEAAPETSKVPQGRNRHGV